jgi:superfamily II DNA or RNA helicase
VTLGFLDPGFLLEETPNGFTRQVERLLPLLGFEDAVNIDGSGDGGGDVIARRQGRDWVFQCKWKLSRAVDVDAVNECFNAMQVYGIDRGVVVTNATFTQAAKDRLGVLKKVSVDISGWSHVELARLYERAADMPPQFTLHTYQERAVDNAWAALMEADRALVFLATGLGKTVVAGRLVTRFLDMKSDAKILVTAHATPLVEQLERSMWRDIPKWVTTRFIGSGSTPDRIPGVVFGVLPTAASYVTGGYRPDLVIVDEAHHVGETGHYPTLLDTAVGARLLGVTATPWRGDRFDIRGVFGEPVVEVSISQGMKRGYLANVNYHLFNDNVDWDFVQSHSEHGYSIRDLNRRLFIPQRDESIRDHVQEVWDRTPSPRAIVFCQSIEHAERMAQLFSRVPGWERTIELHGNLTKREQRDRLLGFRNGNIPILTCVDVLNEGVDVPDVNILCFARVTHSRRIFVQQLGRGLRIRPGKTHVEVLDFVSDLRRLAEVMGLRDQVAEAEIETVDVPRNQFHFADSGIESLLEHWIADVGDLASADETVRLEFPPMETI